MGYRAIRICLTRPEIFRTQLRAIYRASAFRKISIMFPNDCVPLGGKKGEGDRRFRPG